MNGIPGDAIGAFLVKVLYEQDFHLDYLLTMMVRDGRDQVHIARRLLASYHIRDKAGEPIWDNLTIYPESFDSDSAAARVQDTSGKFAAATEDLPYRIPTPQPADPRWPLFMSALSDPELEDLVDKLGDSQHPDGDSLPPLFTGVRKEDVPIIEAFRRFTLHKNDASDDLPPLESLESEIDKTKLTSQTNKTQDKPLLDPSFKKYLRLPPISLPRTPPPSSVRVSTFKAERTPEIQSGDEISSNSADIELVKGDTDQRSVAASGTKPRANLNETLPQNPSSHTYIPCYMGVDNETPQCPRLKKKMKYGDLRKARDRHE